MAEFVPVKLAYKEFEPADGADNSLSPILFLHGLTASKENWCDLPQIIADGTKRKAYALDARNHGESEFTDVFNFDIIADDVLHFMDTVDAQKAVLVGHSMGGITSIKAALKRPERIEMIFVEDMFTKKCPKELLDTVSAFVGIWLEAVKLAPSELTMQEAVKFCIDYLYSKAPPETEFLTDKEKLYDMNLILKKNTDGAYEVQFNSDVIMNALINFETLMSEPSGEFEGPAYFLYGSVSPFFVGKEEDDIKKYFPNAELIEFEGATHNVHGEFPAKYADTIFDRLRK